MCVCDKLPETPAVKIRIDKHIGWVDTAGLRLLSSRQPCLQCQSRIELFADWLLAPIPITVLLFRESTKDSIQRRLAEKIILQPDALPETFQAVKDSRQGRKSITRQIVLEIPANQKPKGIIANRPIE